MTPLAGLLRSSPYRPVLVHPVLRRVLPGLGLSAVGDGMALVGVSWLAVQLAPEPTRGTWVGIAVAAYSLPAAAGTVVFGRWLSGRAGAQLAGWDAVLRACALAAIPLAYAVGQLTIGLFVALLGLSSLLHAWGSAGRFTLVAELLPQEHRLAANSVLGTMTEFSTVLGPVLAGLIIAWSNAATVIAVDAITFAVLAATYQFAVPRRSAPRQAEAAEAAEKPSATVGFSAIWRDRTLLGLLIVSFGFFFAFGPVMVALPIHVVEDLRADAAVLAGYYTAFGIGAVMGGVITPYLRRLSLWPITVGIVLGFGAALLPLGLGAPLAVGLVSFALGGLIWAPFPATTMALFQRSTRTDKLPQVLAANGAVLIMSVPLGSILGAPAVNVFGAATTILLCALTVLAIGLVAVALLARRCRGEAVPNVDHDLYIGHDQL